MKNVSLGTVLLPKFALDRSGAFCLPSSPCRHQPRSLLPAFTEQPRFRCEPEALGQLSGLFLFFSQAYRPGKLEQLIAFAVTLSFPGFCVLFSRLDENFLRTHVF